MVERHAERSEASCRVLKQIPRCARNDNIGTGVPPVTTRARRPSHPSRVGDSDHERSVSQFQQTLKWPGTSSPQFGQVQGAPGS